MSTSTGKRAVRSAKIRNKVLTSFLELSRQKDFEKTHVIQICKKAGISKVTFFSYFKHKEELLMYYFKLWNLKIALLLQKKEKGGISGIYFLFDQIGIEYEEHPSTVYHYVSFLNRIRGPIKPYPVKNEDKELFFGEETDWKQVEFLSFEQQVEKFVLEAIFKKEITQSSDVKELSNLIISLYYGSITTAHLRNVSSFRHFLKQSLDTILKSLR